LAQNIVKGGMPDRQAKAMKGETRLNETKATPRRAKR